MSKQKLNTDLKIAVTFAEIATKSQDEEIMQTKSIFIWLTSFWGKRLVLTLLVIVAAKTLRIDVFVVLIVPAMGLLFSSMFIRGTSDFVQHAHEKALGGWAGNYYQWGNQQMRIIENEGCVWVVDEDLINATGMKLDKQLRRKLDISYKGYGVIPGTKLRGFNEIAALEFLNGKQDRNPEVIKLKLWFERQVFFPLRNKREVQKI